MENKLVLISHLLCPYVQRAAIVLAEKDVIAERRYVDLGNKPDWFLKISPLGKTPVLLVDDVALFESAVICEYLDDTELPRLHPANPLERAQHRAWMEFGSAVLNGVAGFYSAPDAVALEAKRADLIVKFALLENELVKRATDHPGLWFGGQRFGMVDAVFGPVFRYFDSFEQIADFGFFAQTPLVNGWRVHLAARPSVRSAVTTDYDTLLRDFLLRRNGALARRIQSEHNML